MATGSATRKCKQVFLTIEGKTEVSVAKYGIAKRTVSDMKKNKAKILAFKREMADMGMSLKVKTMWLGDNYHYNYNCVCERS